MNFTQETKILKTLKSIDASMFAIEKHMSRIANVMDGKDKKDISDKSDKKDIMDDPEHT